MQLLVRPLVLEDARVQPPQLERPYDAERPEEVHPPDHLEHLPVLEPLGEKLGVGVPAIREDLRGERGRVKPGEW